MTVFSDFIDQMPELLSIDDSYKAGTITTIVQNAMRRLLRDYHFPKTLLRQIYTVSDGDQSFYLPDGFKKDVMLAFTLDGKWSEPLGKRGGIVQRSNNPYSEYFWLEGNNLWLNTVQEDIDEGAELVLFYESSSLEDNQDWLLSDFGDVVLSLSMYRAASILRKPELAQSWGPLWGEDQKSLAVYLNELEFDNSDIMMRSARARHTDRYPAESYT